MDALALPRLSSGSGRKNAVCMCAETAKMLHLCGFACSFLGEINVSDPSEHECEYSEALSVQAAAFKCMGYSVHKYIYYVCVTLLCMSLQNLSVCVVVKL